MLCDLPNGYHNSVGASGSFALLLEPGKHSNSRLHCTWVLQSGATSWGFCDAWILKQKGCRLVALADWEAGWLSTADRTTDPSRRRISPGCQGDILLGVGDVRMKIEMKRCLWQCCVGEINTQILHISIQAVSNCHSDPFMVSICVALSRRATSWDFIYILFASSSLESVAQRIARGYLCYLCLRAEIDSFGNSSWYLRISGLSATRAG